MSAAERMLSGGIVICYTIPVSCKNVNQNACCWVGCHLLHHPSELQTSKPKCMLLGGSVICCTIPVSFDECARMHDVGWGWHAAESRADLWQG